MIESDHYTLRMPNREGEYSGVIVLRFILPAHLRDRLLNYGFFFIIGLVLFIRLDYETSRKATIVEELMLSVVAPTQHLLVQGHRTLKDFYNHYLNVVSTGRENEFLRAQVMTLNDEIFQLNHLKLENERLRQLWELVGQTEGKKLFAQVIGTDPNREYKMLRIDRGALQGIKPKDPVLTAAGLVGHVLKVYDHYAEVLTILDPNHRTDVRIERTRTAGVLEGSGLLMCRLKYLALSEDVNQGDVLVTAGFAKLYPKGLRVGTVHSIHSESHMMTKAIEVKPLVDFSRLEEVIVLQKEGLLE